MKRKRPSYEFLNGIPYRMRLELLQDQYLGTYKARRRAERIPGLVNYTPGSEAERVHREGRA